MHITILALGSRGDIQPYETLGQRLRAVGHRVCFITTENFRALIAAHRLDFYPIPGDAQALVQAAGANMLALLRAFGSLARGLTPDVPPPVRDLRESGDMAEVADRENENAANHGVGCPNDPGSTRSLLTLNVISSAINKAGVRSAVLAAR